MRECVRACVRESVCMSEMCEVCVCVCLRTRATNKAIVCGRDVMSKQGVVLRVSLVVCVSC